MEIKENILEIKDLSVVYQQRSQYHLAVDNVSFSVNKGEVIGIVGESGSGKSTIAKSIMLLNKNKYTFIKQGSIKFYGTDILNMNQTELQNLRGGKISMIFQNASTALNPVYTVGDQIIEMIQCHQHTSYELAKERAIGLLTEVKLSQPEKRINQYPHELSGGMQQRVMIAIALACNPEIVIADEPTTALDVTTQAEILKLLMNLKKKHHLTVIFISHDMGVIAQICDRVLVMYKGRLVEQGPVKDIFYQPSNKYTQALLASIPSINHKVDRLKTLSDFVDE